MLITIIIIGVLLTIVSGFSKAIMDLSDEDKLKFSNKKYWIKTVNWWIAPYGYGNSAGNGSTNTANSNFIGQNAGYDATNSIRANFIGLNAGYQATNADYSNFIGYNTGLLAINADFSNFIGHRVGEGANYATVANFIGAGTGYYATNANHSNFIGYNTGHQATYASYANFLGRYAGYLASYANNSIFIGQQTGYAASGAFYSTFIGLNAGYGSLYAACSQFIGSQAGQNSTNTYNSIFIGAKSGYYDTVDNIPKVTYSGLTGIFTVGELISFSGGNSGRLISNGGGSMSFSLVYPTTPSISESISGVSSGAVAQISSIVKNVGSSILIGSDTSTNGYSNSIAIGKGATNSSENQFVVGRTYNKWQIAGIDYTMPSLQASGTSSLINSNGVLSWANINGYIESEVITIFDIDYNDINAFLQGESVLFTISNIIPSGWYIDTIFKSQNDQFDSVLSAVDYDFSCNVNLIQNGNITYSNSSSKKIFNNMNEGNWTCDVSDGTNVFTLNMNYVMNILDPDLTTGDFKLKVLVKKYPI